uniref:Uncharacterized protein n=1 Tax=Panagrolaimus sp. PS1159 TaxID=55785 RepID=A0AC35GHW7_9BILA
MSSTFNFPALPYLVQKRFAELVDTKIAEKFFQTSQSNAALAKQRIIIKDLEIFFFTSPSYTPRIKDCKEVEVTEKLTLKSISSFSPEELLPLLPLYFGGLYIFEETIIFQTLKALIEHINLTDVHYSGCMAFSKPFSNATEIPAKEFEKFFERLTKIRRIRLSLSLSSRNDKNADKFMTIAKKYEKSLKIVFTSRMVIFTRKVNRRSIYEL